MHKLYGEKWREDVKIRLFLNNVQFAERDNATGEISEV
jgi:hypothetical protein